MQSIGQLCWALAKNVTLTELDLSGCNIEDVGALQVADALAANEVLRSLNLARNRIQSSGAAALGNALHTSNTTLEYLDLCGNLIEGNFEENSSSALKVQAERSPCARTFPWSFREAPSLLAACPSLTYLDMSSCGISDGTTLFGIAKALSVNTRCVPLHALVHPRLHSSKVTCAPTRRFFVHLPESSCILKKGTVAVAPCTIMVIVINIPPA